MSIEHAKTAAEPIGGPANLPWSKAQADRLDVAGWKYVMQDLSELALVCKHIIRSVPNPREGVLQRSRALRRSNKCWPGLRRITWQSDRWEIVCHGGCVFRTTMRLHGRRKRVCCVLRCCARPSHLACVRARALLRQEAARRPLMRQPSQ